SGGIGRWTVLLLSWLEEQPGVSCWRLDTKPRWRGIEAAGMLTRVIGGMVQGLLDTSRMLDRLIRFRADVIHLTTSASLGTVRDICVMSLARLFRVPAVYHIRSGSIPAVMQRNGWEWFAMRWAMRLAKKVIAID